MYNEFILFLILFLALCIQLFKQLHQCSPYFSEVGHYCYFHLTYKESEAKRLRNLTNHIADKCWHQNSGSTGLASEFMLINMMAPLSMECKDTGMGSHSLLQGIFPAQELNPGLLHYRQILYHLSHQGTRTQAKLESICLYG